MEAKEVTCVMSIQLHLPGYCLLTFEDETALSSPFTSNVYRIAYQRQSVNKLKSDLPRYLPFILAVSSRTSSIEGTPLTPQQEFEPLEELLVSPSEAKAKVLSIEISLKPVTNPEDLDKTECNGDKLHLFLSNRSIHILEDMGAGLAKEKVITAVLLEEIAYVKDDPETCSVVLGFSKGYLYQHVPILFSEEATYKDFLNLILKEFHNLVIVITQDDLKKKEKYPVKYLEETGTKSDAMLAVSLKNLVLQVYKTNGGFTSVEFEINIEDIVGFLTNYHELQIEITGKENLDMPKQYTFKAKEQMDRFVKQFAKAKVLGENTQRQLRYCKHIPKSPWLKESTPDDQKVAAIFGKRAIVLKAIVAGIGFCPYKYLLIPYGETKLVILSKQTAVEETITFSDILSISMKFSSFTPMIIQCKRAVYLQTLEVVLPSLKDSLWLRSIFYQYKASHLLLSPTDKHLKTFSLPIFLTTYNMGRQVLQVPLETLFQKAKGCHLAIICLQEIPLLKRGNILKSIETYFESKGLIMIAIHAMWEMALFVFCHKDISQYISRVEKKELTAGFLNVVGNKGGLLIGFELMETRLAVAGVHLKHGQKNVRDRNSTLWKMFKSLRFGFDAIETPLEADHCFLLGDTNYRIDHSFSVLVKELDRNNLGYLLQLDQLNSEKTSGRILHGFQENTITFKPTYKLSKKTGKYTGNELQCPSYTDRVFYSTSSSLKAKMLEYSSEDKVIGSDHKPVYALIEAEILANYVAPQQEWDSMKPLFIHIKNIKTIFYQTHLLDIVPGIKPPFEVLFKFYSAATEDYGQSNRVMVDKLEAAVVLPELHPLKFSINDMRFIRAQKLVAAVYQVKGATLISCIGQAVILLNDAKAGETCLANGSLQLSSRVVGEISLEYKLPI